LLGFLLTFTISSIGTFQYSTSTFQSESQSKTESLVVQKISYTSAFGIKVDSDGMNKNFDNVKERSHSLSFSQKMEFFWKAFLEIYYYGFLISILLSPIIFILHHRKGKK
jgi:hypothetical protein